MLGMGRKIRVKQASKVAGVHGDTIVRWVNRGDLTDHRTNGFHRRIDLDELRALLERRKNDTGKK